MTTGLLDAFDSILWSETLLTRLEAASAELSRKQGLVAEKEWLAQAIERVNSAREGMGDLPGRAMRLPELESLREDHARALQQTAVDSIERLQAGIAFHVSTRAPILEALFGKVKFAAIRRADREDFERFSADFEKRINSSYCKRMFADRQYEFAGPVLEEMRTALIAWRNALSAERLPVSEETALRDEVDGLARRLDLPMRQARLLAEAALSPMRNAFDESGIGNKPKRRGVKAAITESEEAAEAPVLSEQSVADLIAAEASAVEHEATQAPVVEDAAPVEEAPAAVVKRPRVRKAKPVVEEAAPKEQ